MISIGQIFRKDRDSTHFNKRRGGGVLIAVKSSFNCNEVILPDNNVEQVFVMIYSAGLKFLIGSVYFPPDSPVSLYDSHCADIETMLIKDFDEILFLGDYNLPVIDWNIPFENEVVAIDCDLSYKAKIVVDSYSFLGLSQINTIKNKYNKLLDLIFSNTTNVTCSVVDDPLTKCDSYHP
ncbi:hypothetical protein J437_LFUL019033, partial [Ladona fulva]